MDSKANSTWKAGNATGATGRALDAATRDDQRHWLVKLSPKDQQSLGYQKLIFTRLTW